MSLPSAAFGVVFSCAEDGDSSPSLEDFVLSSSSLKLSELLALPALVLEVLSSKGMLRFLVIPRSAEPVLLPKDFLETLFLEGDDNPVVVVGFNIPFVMGVEVLLPVEILVVLDSLEVFVCSSSSQKLPELALPLLLSFMFAGMLRFLLTPRPLVLRALVL